MKLNAILLVNIINFLMLFMIALKPTTPPATTATATAKQPVKVHTVMYDYVEVTSIAEDAAPGTLLDYTVYHVVETCGNDTLAAYKKIIYVNIAEDGLLLKKDTVYSDTTLYTK